VSKTYGDRWIVDRQLDEGGQAWTYLVHDSASPNAPPSVLKRLKNHARLERFQREYKAIATLSHPNIVKPIAADLEGTRPYLVMEYCEGGSLAAADPTWFSQSHVAFRIFDDVCGAVAHAHSKGIVHRDLKPGNILLRSNDGPAVVADFGLCLLADQTERITQTTEAVGPRLFMAPELEDGRLDDVRPEADTYSLGKLLYWLLSGGTVFSREKYRDPKWDLKGRSADTVLGWRNIYYEHVNRLLDLMVTVDLTARRDVANIRVLAGQCARLVAKEFSPVSGTIPRPCSFCGKGYYVLRASDQNQLHSFVGIHPVGSPDWRVFCCTNCGNVQMFQIEKAAERERWQSAE